MFIDVISGYFDQRSFEIRFFRILSFQKYDFSLIKIVLSKIRLEVGLVKVRGQVRLGYVLD